MYFNWQIQNDIITSHSLKGFVTFKKKFFTKLPTKSYLQASKSFLLDSDYSSCKVYVFLYFFN